MSSAATIPSPPPSRASFFASFARSFRRYPTMWFGGVVLGAMGGAAIFAPWIAPYDPNALSVMHRLSGPTADFWFGTDSVGRDVFSRIIYGARVSLAVGLSVSIMASIVGILIGLLCGAHKVIDLIVMRFVDGMMSIPPILLAIALVALWGTNVQNVIIALTIADAPRVARLMRSVVLSAREEPYVDAAVTSGTRSATILFRHILPNTFAPILVQATYIFASAMVAEASLSFIGAGVPTNIPAWGSMMSEARVLWQIHPQSVFVPAAFLSLAVLSVNMIGDGLRDALDPRLVKRL